MWRCFKHAAACGKPDAFVRAVSVERAKSLSDNASSVTARYHHYKDGKELADDYEVEGHVLGAGCCGNVVRVRHRQTGGGFALKRISKRWVNCWKLRVLASEVEIHLALDHPGIVSLRDVYEAEDEICLVMELCRGGELYRRLEELRTFTDADAAQVVVQLLRAICYLHDRHIVHRDLKLENILYELDGADPGPLKLTDFGFAELWDDKGKPMMTCCGSIGYVSPDVLLGAGYGNKCDLWSLGVVAWMLLAGYPPFHGEEQQMLKKIKAGLPDWSYKCRWRHVSREAVDFVNCLLTRDPSHRPSAREALAHPWLAGLPQSFHEHLPPQPLPSGALRAMRSYLAGGKLRKALLQMVVHECSPQVTRDLRDIFLSLDREHKGTLRCSELLSSLARHWDEVRLQRSPAPGLGVDELRALEELFLECRDCEMSYSEFLAATLDVESKACQEACHAVFERLDVDGSGTVDGVDASVVFGKTIAGENVSDLICDASLTGKEALDFTSFKQLVLGTTEAPSAGADPSGGQSNGHRQPTVAEYVEDLEAGCTDCTDRLLQRLLCDSTMPPSRTTRAGGLLAALPTPSRARRRSPCVVEQQKKTATIPGIAL